MKGKSARKPRRSIVECIEAGDVAGVRGAVAGGDDLLDEMEDTSPLAIAVEKSDLQMVETLLELGHDPDLGGIVVPLALAACNNNVQIVDLLLKRGANVEEPGEEGETAVMWAAGAGNLAMVKRLIDAGADIERRDRDGQDALDYAVNGRCTEVVEFLLPNFPKARGDQIKRQAHLWRDSANEKVSPLAAKLEEAIDRPVPTRRKRASDSLIRTFEDGRKEKFLELLDAGADPNETNKEGTTILGLVASFSSVFDLVEPLLKAGADPNRGDLFRPLSLAAAMGCEPAVRMLLEAGADVHWRDADGETALMAAASAGDLEAAQMLLAAGADPNAEDYRGHTAYWYALDGSNSEVADLLRPLTSDAEDSEKSWRKNKEGKSLELRLLAAVRGGDVEYVRRFLAEGAPVDSADSSGDTPLHHAADNDDIEMIRVLLDAGAPIEAEGSAERTPLVTAANSGRLNAARCLLDAGANVHAKRDAILCYACERKDCLEMVKLLLEAGAKVNVIGGWRHVTPLHVATEHDQLAVVQRLLKAGADVHVRDSNGWTPFLNAALRGSVETVKVLINAGSDIKAVDAKGRNAYDLASKWGKPDVADFLKPLLGDRA